MKLTLILLFASTFLVQAGGFSQDVKVTLSLKEVSVTSFFKAIENETKLRFTFSNDIIPEGKIVTINAKQTPVSQVMDAVMLQTNLKYRFDKTTGIFIISRNDNFLNEAQQQNLRNITGTVSGESGEPLAGVSVTIKGSNKATITADNGSFAIDVDDNTKFLQFSFIGRISQEINIEGKSSVAVVMPLSNKSLNEVVVVGYGTQKRTLITGAVSSVNSKTLNELPAVSISQALQGRVAGLQVTNNGSPGSDPIV
ncbi:MAG: carboxypeptidase-like regulatory domain-containing protein, partial [Ferruginibacter sp.]